MRATRRISKTVMLHTYLAPTSAPKMSRVTDEGVSAPAAGWIKQYAWPFRRSRNPKGATSAFQVDLEAGREVQRSEFAFQRRLQ
jgi:hypothetical protein